MASEEIAEQLKAALEECARLREENKNLKSLLGIQKEKADISNERYSGVPIVTNFNGELRSMQKEAASEILKHDIGVLSAPTAFGKTTLTAYLIAERKVNTLVCVMPPACL